MAKPIEAFSRGLHVLDALLLGGPTTTLAELHRQTEIPKPTLISLLESLKQQHAVEERDGALALTSVWLLMVQMHTNQRLLELNHTRTNSTD